MKALRAHPFFSEIRWETLWTDPAPPLEAGLVKKEQLSVEGDGGADMGKVWEEFMGDGDRGRNGDDDIEWASEGEGEGVRIEGFRHSMKLNGKHEQVNGVVNAGKDMREEGPMGEAPRYQLNVLALPKRVTQLDE